MDDLVERVRNADDLLIDSLILALSRRFSEVRPEYELLIASIEKKRDFSEQADEYISYMQSLKETEMKLRAKVIPFHPLTKKDRC